MVTAATRERVPTSGEYAFGFVNDVNDTIVGSGRDQFNYVGAGWQHGPGDGGTFSADNTWNNTAGAYATLDFTGTRVVLYGVRDPVHGTSAVSIDGGPEALVDLRGPRRGNVAVWGSPVLAQGPHTLRVRVVGDGYVVIDRATVVAAAPAMIVPPRSAAASLRPTRLRQERRP